MPARQRVAASVLLIATLTVPWIALTQAAFAQDSLAPIVSMGFPARYHWYAGGLAGSDRRNRDAEVAGEALIGFYRDIVQPAAGVAGFALEGYAGRLSGKGDGGMRALITIRAFRLALGEDFSFRDGIHDFIIRLDDPIVRGGILRGGLMRFEWLPGRHNSYNFGLTFPLFQPWAGKTRPRRQSYRVAPAHPLAANFSSSSSGADPVGVTAALGRARTSALRVEYLTTPRSPTGTSQQRQEMLAAAKRFMETRDADFPSGHSYAAEVAFYHRQLTLAFASALGVDAQAAVVESVTNRARGILLDDVLIPFNQRVGWFRNDDVLDAFVNHDGAEFASWIAGSALVPSDRRAAAVHVNAQLLGIVRDAFAAAHKRWGDSRLTWIPLQLALREEDHATQSQIDALVERMVQQPFTRGNSVNYLPSERFTRELIRTVRATRDYHVLWIHDIKGGPSPNDPDTVSAHLVIDGYLAALTSAVQAFDRTGRIPTFLIFLDEWYYELAHGRFWLELLRDPLGKELSFGPGARAIDERTRSAQQALRLAVAASPALQRETARRGQEWLRNLVSVHVSITNPGDPSFPGRLRARDLTLALADDWMRDHRKIVMFDVSEDDPAQGGAIFTGEGVGAQYEEGAWEDRSLEVRGPGILPLKRYARELLTRQGFEDEQIPPGLRQRPLAPGYSARVDSLVRADWVGRMLTASNSTGYDDKFATVAKATLYSLMPAGSRIVAPDSQWSSFFWGALLGSAALRGCQVFVIGPGLENAPYGSNAWPQFSLQHDIFAAMITFETLFHDQIAAAGGALHVGLYQGEVSTRDFEQRVREFSAGVQRNPFVRTAFPFPPSLYDLMGDPDRVLQAIGYAPSPPQPGDTTIRPKLHLKSQLYASREFIDRVLPLPQWREIILSALRARVRQNILRPEGGQIDSAISGAPNSLTAMAPLAPALMARSPAQRDAEVVYLTLGSQNQDDRSLMENGEILAVISGEAALAGVTDYVYLVVRATWVKTIAELDKVQPPVSGFKQRLARWIRRLV